MGIRLKEVSVNDGLYKILLCFSNGVYYVNVIHGEDRETVVSDITDREVAKKKFLDIIWDIS